MSKTPLQIAREGAAKASCQNCHNHVYLKGINYCELSGKIILLMHMDARRDVQCKDVFKAKQKGAVCC